MSIREELLLDEVVEQLERLANNPTKVSLDSSELQQLATKLDALINTIPRQPSPEELALALKAVQQPDQSAALIKQLTAEIEKLNKKMTNMVRGASSVLLPQVKDGKVEVSNFPTSTEVSNFPATQAVNVTNTDVRVTNTTAQEIGQGKFNMYGTGRLSLSVAGNLRAIIRNPSTSGKTIKIHRVAGLGTSTGWATLYINPTSGVPASAARPSMNAIVGGGIAGVAEVRADVDATVALSGGTDTGIVIGMAGGRRTELNLPPLILSPGVTLGINIPFAGAADATLSIYTTEV